MLLPKEDLINIGIVDGDNEKVNENILKEFDEEHQKKFREEWGKNPKNYDEELDDNQMVLIPLTELDDLVEKEMVKDEFKGIER